MKHLAVICTAAALAAGAVSADVNELSGIDVETELEDVANANALDFWPDIARDLEEALASATIESEDAPRLVVRLSEISLDGATVLDTDGGFNTLEGWVYVYPDRDADAEPTAALVNDQIRLEASAVPVDTSRPGRIVILPGDTEFYRALVATFAEVTLRKLDDI
jgi:hypothetical protein